MVYCSYSIATVDVSVAVLTLMQTLHDIIGRACVYVTLCNFVLKRGVLRMLMARWLQCQSVNQTRIRVTKVTNVTYCETTITIAVIDETIRHRPLKSVLQVIALKKKWTGHEWVID